MSESLFDLRCSEVDLEKYLDDRKRLIDDFLEYVLLPVKENSLLYAAMSYSLLAPAKRLRPILMMSASECNGVDAKTVLPFASALEMIHTYSLIHDDLPIMDNSDLRRGKPTCHKIYGSDIALLAGDALLSYAFEVISSKELADEFSSDKLVRIIKEFASASGFRGMVGGQAMDVSTESATEIESETILYIEKLKTAALFKLPTRVAGIIANVDEDELNALSRFGENLGISFQITDDLLDVTSSSEVIGKDTGKDVKNLKASFVFLYGTETAREMANDYKKKAIDYLLPYGEKYNLLIAIAEYIGKREK